MEEIIKKIYIYIYIYILLFPPFIFIYIYIYIYIKQKEIPKNSVFTSSARAKSRDPISVAVFEHTHSGIMGNQGKMAGN